MTARRTPIALVTTVGSMTAEEALTCLESWAHDYDDVTIMCVGTAGEYAVILGANVIRGPTLIEAVKRASEFLKTR